MSKIVQIKIFNDVLDQFLDYLETNFQDFRSDIILSRSTVEFIRRSNPRLVVEQYINCIYPFKTHIFDCNEDFFLNFNNLNLEDIGFTKDNLILISKVKNIWVSSNINDKQKAYIWLYFQKLIQAGEKVIH
jgi:hypothetical protein